MFMLTTVFKKVSDAEPGRRIALVVAPLKHKPGPLIGRGISGLRPPVTPGAFLPLDLDPPA